MPSEEKKLSLGTGPLTEEQLVGISRWTEAEFSTRAATLRHWPPIALSIVQRLLAEVRRARQVELSEEERAALKELQADSESMLAWLAAVPKDEMAWRKTAIAALDRLTGGGK